MKNLRVLATISAALLIACLLLMLNLSGDLFNAEPMELSEVLKSRRGGDVSDFIKYTQKSGLYDQTMIELNRIIDAKETSEEDRARAIVIACSLGGKSHEPEKYLSFNEESSRFVTLFFMMHNDRAPKQNDSIAYLLDTIKTSTNAETRGFALSCLLRSADLVNAKVLLDIIDAVSKKHGAETFPYVRGNTIFADSDSFVSASSLLEEIKLRHPEIRINSFRVMKKTNK